VEKEALGLTSMSQRWSEPELKPLVSRTEEQKERRTRGGGGGGAGSHQHQTQKSWKKLKSSKFWKSHEHVL